MNLADLHFDPFIACYQTKPPCHMIEQLQMLPVTKWESVLKQTKKISFTRQDTSYAVLKAALGSAKEVAAQHNVQFVVVLGDLLAHNFWHYYKKYSPQKTRASYQIFVKKLIQFLVNELGNTFPNIPVYPVIGNNDAYGGDYYFDASGLFFKDFSKCWQRLLKNKNANSVSQQLAIAGYYAVEVLPAVKLVVLNTVLFSTNVKGSFLEHAAENELQWLYSQLAEAKQKKQKVIIAMHIPPGIEIYSFQLSPFWKSIYFERFKEIIRSYSNEVAGLMAAHLHIDWGYVMPALNSILITGTPAISPLFGNDPGFKLEVYDQKVGEIRELKTYYLFLEKHDLSYLLSRLDIRWL